MGRAAVGGKHAPGSAVAASFDQGEVETAHFRARGNLHPGRLLRTQHARIVGGRERPLFRLAPAEESETGGGRAQEVASRRNVKKAKLPPVIGLGPARRDQTALPSKAAVAAQHDRDSRQRIVVLVRHPSFHHAASNQFEVDIAQNFSWPQRQGRAGPPSSKVLAVLLAVALTDKSIASRAQKVSARLEIHEFVFPPGIGANGAGTLPPSTSRQAQRQHGLGQRGIAVGSQDLSPDPTRFLFRLLLAGPCRNWNRQRLIQAGQASQVADDQPHEEDSRSHGILHVDWKCFR